MDYRSGGNHQGGAYRYPPGVNYRLMAHYRYASWVRRLHESGAKRRKVTGKWRREGGTPVTYVLQCMAMHDGAGMQARIQYQTTGLPVLPIPVV